MPKLFMTRHKLHGTLDLTVHTAHSYKLLALLPAARVLVKTPTTTMLSLKYDSFKGKDGSEEVVGVLRGYYEIVEG